MINTAIIKPFIHGTKTNFLPNAPQGRTLLLADGFKEFDDRRLGGTDNHVNACFYDPSLFPCYIQQPRSKEKQIPNMGGFQQEWINACKGDLKTSCDFDYSGTAIEQMLLGLVAYRVGKKIKYDGKAGRVIGNAAANELLSRKYRKGWKLNG